ncbi:SdpI family protein [Nesterenkonia alba]|uniref:SdpI family protein n=1 Tax=Nesterenkonia alba TaxID=515814 RepID=UPI0003B46564|nr:SdpI family protein [Nesterenkonia alba]
MAEVLGALFTGAAGVLVLILGVVFARGKLSMNAWVGIRFPSTTVNEEIWQASHQAASGWIILAGVGPLVTAVLALIFGDPDGVWTLVGMLLLLAFILVAGAVASKEAKKVAAAQETTPGAMR